MRAMGKAASAPELAGGPNEEADQAATLLVADDDPDILRIVQFYLQKHKYRVHTALNGEDALNVLAHEPEVELILSDVMMPVVSGLELLQTVRETPAYTDIPVILISAEGETSKKVAGLNLGADDYITKPFNFDELMARVRNHLRLRRLQRQVMLANDLLTRQNEQFLEDLEAARGVQMALMPARLPTSDRFRVGTRYLPVERVGGDFFDVVTLDGGRKVGVLVADVCGHGVAAAFITAMTKITFRNACFNSFEPGTVLAEMNRALYANLKSGFVTAFYGVYDTESRELAYASGGHPPLLLHRRNEGRIIELPPQSTFLGFFDTVRYETDRQAVQPGDRLLFYTDGIYEGVNADREQYGMERVSRHLLHLSDKDIQTLLNGLVDDLLRFVGTPTLDDDVTLVGLDILD